MVMRKTPPGLTEIVRLEQPACLAAARWLVRAMLGPAGARRGGSPGTEAILSEFGRTDMVLRHLDGLTLRVSTSLQGSSQMDEMYLVAREFINPTAPWLFGSCSKPVDIAEEH